MRKKRFLLIMMLMLMITIVGCNGEQEYMNLQGEVIDNSTNEAVTGANIDLNKYSEKTNAQGVFQIENIPVIDEDDIDTEDRILTINAPGYKTHTEIISLNEGNQMLKVELSKRNEDKFFYTKENDDGRKDIYFSSLSTKQSDRVLKNAWSPSYSVSRNEILYLSDKNNSINVFRYNLETKESIQITYSQAKKESPSWKKDKVLYSSNRTGNFEIYETTLNGDKLIKLTDNKLYDSKAIYSNKTNLIAYISEGKSRYNRVNVMEANGDKKRLLNTALSDDYFIKWQNDKLYFNNRKKEIVEVNPNGSRKKTIFSIDKGNVKDFDVNKNNFLLINNQEDNFKIKLFNVDNNDIKTLITSETKIENPNWQK